MLRFISRKNVETGSQATIALFTFVMCGAVVCQTLLFWKVYYFSEKVFESEYSARFGPLKISMVTDNDKEKSLQRITIDGETFFQVTDPFLDSKLRIYVENLGAEPGRVQLLVYKDEYYGKPYSKSSFVEIEPMKPPYPIIFEAEDWHIGMYSVKISKE